jgi:hypothetical protein
MENEGRESYEILLAVCKADHLQLTIGYKQMRDLLERLCRLHMHNGSLQMTDLSARISFVAAKVGLSVAEQNRLHTFRLTSFVEWVSGEIDGFTEQFFLFVVVYVGDFIEKGIVRV